MRTAISIVMVLMLVTVCVAKDETLFGSHRFEPGGYGGPVLKVTTVDGEIGIMMGGRGAFCINHVFGIGGGGYGLVNEVKAKDTAPADRPYLGFGYGGVILEGIFFSPNMVHFTGNILIGGGAIYFFQDWDEQGEEHHDYHDSDHIWIVEPEVAVELNLTDYFRINLGASYRIVGEVELPGYDNSDLSGFAGSIFFKFGGNM
ncbi:hypothetical protein JXI42_11300 [bacterium]|nr:hypothetical protein [bacterium]